MGGRCARYICRRNAFVHTLRHYAEFIAIWPMSALLLHAGLRRNCDAYGRLRTGRLAAGRDISGGQIADTLEVADESGVFPLAVFNRRQAEKR